MKIYTGNYANLKKYTAINLHPISISISAKYFLGDFYRPLNPKRDFMNDIEEIYTPKFNDILSKLDANKVFNDLKQISKNKDVVLLCHENEDDFCHRHLVGKWLQENLNIEVKELGKMKKNVEKILQLQLL